ncbi:MAG: hypothetical protein IJS14_08095 [Lentisphaeria bacterium]|nr:hypothetical protein [Lentisphaeria bacterium]
MADRFFRKILNAVYPGLSIAAAAVTPCLIVFLNNREHFTIRFGAVSGLALVASAGIILVCAIPLILFDGRRGQNWLTAGLQALAVTMILQYHFWSSVFPFSTHGNMGIDGAILFLMVFHILALLLPFVFSFIFRSQVCRWSGKITAVIVLSRLAMLAGPLMEKPETPDYDFRDYTISDEGKFTFASKRNLIVIVVDCMGERICKEVLRKYPELRDSLRDFTCFDRIDSPLPRTMYAVPAMLTGIDFPRKEDGRPESDDHAEYLNRASRSPHSLFQLCRKRGWRREGYPFMLQTLSYSPEVIDNTQEINYQAKKQSAVKIVDSVLENLVPGFLHGLLEEYYYIATDRFITPTQKTDQPRQVPWDRVFYQRLQQEFRVGDFPDGMKYLHLHGAHEPIRTDEHLKLASNSLKYHQLRGSLRNVELLIEKLKQAGLYDEATIVISGDHTERYTPEVIAFIKRPYERHEKMVFDSVPGQVSDLAGTMAKATGLDPRAKSLFDLPPLPGSLQSTRVNDISVLDFPAWQFAPDNELPAFGGSIEIPFGMENRHIIIDLAHEKLAGLQSFVLMAENLFTGDCVRTELSLDRTVNYARCDISALPKGIYRIGIFVRTQTEMDSEPVNESLLLPRYLVIRDRECVFTENPEEIKPEPMRIGRTVMIRPMTPVPQLILPANHDPTDNLVRLTPEQSIGVRLPASDKVLKLTVSLFYSLHESSDLTVYVNGEPQRVLRIPDNEFATEILLPPEVSGKERVVELRFAVQSILRNREDHPGADRITFRKIRLDAVEK